MNQQGSSVNLSLTERRASLVAGGALVGLGLMRGGVIGALMALVGGSLAYRGATGHSEVYKSMRMTTAVKTNANNVSVPHQQGIHVGRTVMINRPVADVYAFWRNFENLPQFMNHLQSVKMLDEKRSHWVAKAPVGTTVEWNAEIVNEIRNEVIGWRSLADAQVANSGSVRFREAGGGQGTEIRVEMEYVPPAGNLGVVVARLLGREPEQQITEDLNRFKAIMENNPEPTGSGQM